MTTASAPTTTADRRPQPRSITVPSIVNLLLKELRESAGVVVAGLAIFWLLPAVLHAVYCALDPKSPIRYGGSWGMLAGLGWLFAAIVAAHTVCRDWGKDEERFLTAQPVGPRAIILAKLLAGVIAVGFVFAVAGAWDLLWYYHSGNLAKECPSEIQAAIALATCVACAVACAYALAFAAAVITRQMLASVLLAVMVLVIWAVAPMMSNRLVDIHPGWNLTLSNGTSLGTFFGIAVAAVLAGGVIASLAAAGRERSVNVGFKQLAWTVAGVVLILFGLAMNEVGNSLTITDQMIIGKVDVPSNQHLTGQVVVAQHGNRFHAALVPAYYLGPPRGAEAFPVVSFKVEPSGRITERTGWVALTGLDNAGRTIDGEPYTLRTHWLTDIRTDPDTGDLLVFGQSNYRSVNPLSKPSRRTTTQASSDTDKQQTDGRKRAHFSERVMWLTRCPLRESRYAWTTPPKIETVVHAELRAYGHLPPNVRVNLRATAWTEKYLFLLHAERLSAEEMKRHGYQYVQYQRDVGPRHLLVLEWSDGLDAKPRYHFRLPSNIVSHMRLRDGMLELMMGELGTVVARLDPDHPETWSDGPATTTQPGKIKLDTSLTAMQVSEERFLGGKRGLLWKDDLFYVTDNRGLRIYQRPTQGKGEPKLIGEANRSPLALALFAGTYTSPILVDDGLLLQIVRARSGGTARFFYDVRHPRRPCLAGFQRAPTQYDPRKWFRSHDFGEFVHSTGKHIILFAPLNADGSDWLVTVYKKP